MNSACVRVLVIFLIQFVYREGRKFGAEGKIEGCSSSHLLIVIVVDASQKSRHHH